MVSVERQLQPRVELRPCIVIIVSRVAPAADALEVAVHADRRGGHHD